MTKTTFSNWWQKIFLTFEICESAHKVNNIKCVFLHHNEAYVIKFPYFSQLFELYGFKNLKNHMLKLIIVLGGAASV